MTDSQVVYTVLRGAEKENSARKNTTFRDRVVSRNAKPVQDQLVYAPAVYQRCAQINALGCVATIRDRSVADFLSSDAEAVRTVSVLVESLIWPVVCFRSEDEDGRLFDKVELGRVMDSFTKTAKVLRKYLSADNREQTFVKYYVDSYFCDVVEDSEKPARPEWIEDGDELFVGVVRKYVRRAIAHARCGQKGQKRRALSFIYSLQKGSKQMWPALGSIKKQAALDDHAVAFGTQQEPPRAELVAEVEALSLEINGRDSAAATKFCPSSSACFEYNRSQGGALGGHFDPLDLSNEARFERGRLGLLRDLHSAITDWREVNFQVAELGAWASLDRMVEDLGRSEGTMVEVLAIPEPGKFRVLSKGPGMLYSVLQPFQARLLRNWKVRPESTMLSPDLTRQVQSVYDKTKDLEGFIWESVDYKAATDFLKSAMTRAVIEPLDFYEGYELALHSVQPGILRYRGGKVVVQREGQLMGHPLSFTSLCTINLACWRLSVKEWSRGHPDREAVRDDVMSAVVVNGDDLVARMSSELSEIFWRNAASAGFKKSVGKSYRSAHTCQINSQVYRCFGGEMVRVGYLNLRLITGSNIKNGDSAALPTQVGKELSSMVRLCPWSARAVPAAFRRWGDEFFTPHFKPNWYVPVHLGGFGMDVRLAPDSWRVTRAQRLMAARFVAQPELALYRCEEKPVPRTEALRLAGACLTFRMRRGDDYDVKNDYEDSTTDEWTSRIALAARMSNPLACAESDRKVARRFKREYRLKGMGDDALMGYWDGRVCAVAAPPCPPLNLMRYQIGSVEFVRRQRRSQMRREAHEMNVTRWQSPPGYKDWATYEWDWAAEAAGRL